jgi:hypothetical protein
MRPAIYVTAIVIVQFISACDGGVCREGPRSPAEVEECCEQRDPEENNCSACASQPDCAWCAEADGTGHCTGQNGECAGQLVASTAGCANPDMPPGSVDE